ncbi:coagulation factor XIII B chain isoform X2 [Salmo salar]|uniref:Coagulation factor XIII B chain isoform X2 n=1 Tax=Salmo salar TaxID=8030 RepID=A0ABM3CBC0_SALSA|nr:coagulation factor XIII B chain isoform X2 [Salmo salar]
MFYSFHFYCIYHLINMKSSLTLLCLVVWVNVDASSAQTEYCGKPEGAGRRMQLIPDRERYENGDQVEYGCLAICKNGEWDKTIKGKDYCSKPEGADTRMLLIPDRETYENGDQIDYGCLSGPNTGARGKATCKNGEWSKTIECQVTCPPAPPIDNGDHTVKARDGEGVVTEVSYQCNLDYTLSFTGSIRCLNGEWETSPKCLRPCEIHTFDAEYHLQDLPLIMYMEHGEKKTIHCKHGYYHKHASESNITDIEVECNDGEINYPFPKCIAFAKCKLSLPPTRGTSYTPAGRNLFSPDERVTVTCTSGFWIFFLHQTENTIQCKEDGKWSSSTDCELITCGDPRDPLVSSPNRWQRGQLRGTQRYNCRTGFKTTNAQGVATCTSDGSWTPDPLCEEITCDKPDILNAVIKDPKTRYKINDPLTYECKMNYELLDSTTRPTATCTKNHWTQCHGYRRNERSKVCRSTFFLIL